MGQFLRSLLPTRELIDIKLVRAFFVRLTRTPVLPIVRKVRAFFVADVNLEKDLPSTFANHRRVFRAAAA